MRKFIVVFFPFIVIVLMIYVYEEGRNNNEEADTNEYKYELISNFFNEFQETNDDWTKTIDGHKKLVKAFEDKMTSDIDFAKACISYETKSRNCYISKSGSISSYEKDEYEEGEVKAFDIILKVPLVKPLYNGQKTIKVKYEIISLIPSTNENHSHPYISNANYCSKFDSFLKSEYDGVLDLGCYILTRKDK